METTELLLQLQSELKSYVEKAAEEKKVAGSVAQETKDAMKEVTQRLNAIEVRMATPDTGSEDKSFEDLAAGNKSMRRLKKEGRATARMSFKSLAELEQKTTITSATLGSGTQGVLMPMKIPCIVPLSQLRLTIRDV